MKQEIRNIAIIAHVDHGKTTFVDAFLKQSGTFRENQQVATCAMDSGDIERERGITIFAKCTSVEWNGTRINIVDTPGHADFGGEVERILSMVDGVIVLVDAAEGPLPQTKFVVGKALKLGLKPIVVINKIDRSDARPVEVHNEIFDLFANLGATDEQLDFPTLFASGREGWAVNDLADERKDITPLFNKIIEHVPAPVCDENGPFKLLVTTLEADPFVGRILTGRIVSGKIKTNQTIKALSRDGEQVETARASRILAFRGLKRQPIEEGLAGDIVSIAGFEEATVADTLADLSVEEPLHALPIDPPTLAMTFSINTSPLAGTEGDKVTSRMIWDRLEKEAEGNIALKITRTDTTDAFEVAGRGELQLGILIETMRREGYELSVSRPRVVYKEEAGVKLEPIEEVIIDVDDAYTGVVVEKLSIRKAELLEMTPSGGGKTRLVFLAPSRGMIGYYSEFLTDTSGTGVLNRLFHGYAPYKGVIMGRRNGVLVSTDSGKAVPYALWKIQERGPLFIPGGVAVYSGMIIGANSKSGDIEVNPIKGKQLTNMRASGKDDAVALFPPVLMSLEGALAYIEDDELVEVTPKSIRLRKKMLDSNDRRKAERSSKKED
ncbi:MAG: translational GTPase TypA [Lactobacillales bacterium]|jgi:GTP-binding protein|nr:translational GTPase TypA [Lactobacillales bacterium]